MTEATPEKEGTPEEEQARIAEYAKEWGTQYAHWLRACELGKPFGDTIGDTADHAIHILPDGTAVQGNFARRPLD